RVGVPGAAGSLRGGSRDRLCPQGGVQLQDILGGGPAAVEEHHGAGRPIHRRPGAPDGRPGVRIAVGTFAGHGGYQLVLYSVPTDTARITADRAPRRAMKPGCRLLIIEGVL